MRLSEVAELMMLVLRYRHPVHKGTPRCMTVISYGLSMTSSIRLTFPSNYDDWEEGNGHHLIMLELRKKKIAATKAQSYDAKCGIAVRLSVKNLPSKIYLGGEGLMVGRRGYTG
jgi:hypothetical protein